MFLFPFSHSRSGCHFGSCLCAVTVKNMLPLNRDWLGWFRCGLTETQRSVWRKIKSIMCRLKNKWNKTCMHILVHIFQNEVILVLYLKLYLPPVLVSLGCIIKHHRLGSLNKEIYFLTRLEAGSWRSRCPPTWSGLVRTLSGFQMVPFSLHADMTFSLLLFL